MPDFGYKIKRFGWLKDYPSIRDYGPEVGQKLLSDLTETESRRTSKTKSMVPITSKTVRMKLPVKVDNQKYCSRVKDQGQLGSCTANMAANMY